jgi:hypothetical protein
VFVRSPSRIGEQERTNRAERRRTGRTEANRGEQRRTERTISKSREADDDKMLTLEKYCGSKSRHTCPRCGRRKRFCSLHRRSYGHYVADDVGRCNRESRCGYHRKPRDYSAEDPAFRDSFVVRTRKDEFSRVPRLPDFIDNRHLVTTLRNYEANGLVQFLLDLFPDDSNDVWAVVRAYCIGTFPKKNGGAIRASRIWIEKCGSAEAS